ncbi:DUF432 domain-containing protein [Sunxiuqinia sp. A32]|uniref:DUF432 domain-containing protein n=1 Tax=Sunxiuqinia sp. A32 TaxID=3461496 RepID=UPI0040463875
MEKQKTVWGKFECKAGNSFQFSGGCCLFSIKRISNGWKITEIQKNEMNSSIKFDSISDFPEDEKCNVFQTGRSEQIHLLPALPVKPIVFKTKSQIKISPKQSIRLFLKVPCNVQLYYSQADSDHLMAEHELVRLSDTWFGEADNGEVAFAIGDFYSLQLDSTKTTAFEAICPVKINNNSNVPLELQRFLVHVESLNIYRKSNQLITNLVSIDFKGPDQISNILYSTEKNIHGENPVLIAHARNAGSKNILGKSFHFIKHFTQ